MRRMILVVAIVLAFASSASATLTISLSDPDKTVSISQLHSTGLVWYGTITNGSANPCYVTGAQMDFYVGNPTVVCVDGTYWSTWDLDMLCKGTLAGGESFTGPLLSFHAYKGMNYQDISLGYHSGAAMYDLRDVSNHQWIERSNRAYWSFTVVAPEPSSIVALLCGICGMGGLLRKSRKLAQ